VVRDQDGSRVAERIHAGLGQGLGAREFVFSDLNLTADIHDKFVHDRWERYSRHLERRGLDGVCVHHGAHVWPRPVDGEMEQ